MLNKENNPWLGLASYEYEDAYRFFGREKELERLKDCIGNNLITTIYGISGAGKTSLINAGMCPLLEKEGFLPIRIRMEHGTSKSYSAQIIKSVSEAINKVGGEIETIDHLESDEMVPESEKLWMFFYTSSFWSSTNHRLCPVVFIDQFEEIFTKNDDDEVVKTFFDSISALQYDTPPATIARLLDTEDHHTSLKTKLDFRVVLTMREDFLARLEDYAYDSPALRKNRIGIKRMNGTQALDVITRPQPELVSRDVALKIIAKVSGREIKDSPVFLEQLSVDTSILSLFCSEVYNKAVDQQLNTITSGLIDQFGEDILASFYVNTMKLVPKRTADYLETHLLTRSGFRNSVAMEDVLADGIPKEDLDKLSEKRLIRIETSDGTERVEFTHDVLCAIAKEHRNKAIERNNRKQSNSRTIGFLFDLVLPFLFILPLVIHFYVNGSLPGFGDSTSCLLFYVALVILLFNTFILFPYRHSKDRNAGITSIVSFLGNVLAVLCFFGLYENETLLRNEHAGFKRYLMIVWAFFGIYLIIHCIRSFGFGRKRKFKEAMSYAFRCRIYKDNPEMATLLKAAMLVIVWFVSFIVGLSMDIKVAFFTAPLCGLLTFWLLSSLLGQTVRFNAKSILSYVVQAALILGILASQFLQHHQLLTLLSLASLLTLTVIYVLNDNVSIPTSKKVRNILVIWALAFAFTPTVNAGYNLFNHTQYQRTSSVLSGNDQLMRFLIIKDTDNHQGVRDRWNIVVPVEYQSVDFIMMNLASKSSYSDYYYYSSEKKYDTIDITFFVNENERWRCSEHLDMHNICSKSILDAATCSSDRLKYFIVTHEELDSVSFENTIAHYLINQNTKNTNNSFGYYDGLAYFTLFKGDYAKSEQYARVSIKEDSIHSNIYAYATLYCALQLQNRPEDVIEVIKAYENRGIFETTESGYYLTTIDEVIEDILEDLVIYNVIDQEKKDEIVILLDDANPYLFDKAIEYSDNIKSYITQYLGIAESQQIDKVIDLYSKRRGFKESEPNYLNDFAYITLFTGDFGKAERYARETIKADPSYILAYTNLFDALYFQYGLNEEAVNIIETYKNDTVNSYTFLEGILEDFANLSTFGVVDKSQSFGFYAYLLQTNPSRLYDYATSSDDNLKSFIIQFDSILGPDQIERVIDMYVQDSYSRFNSPDESLANKYYQYAYYTLFTSDYAKSEQYAREAIKADSCNIKAYTQLFEALFLQFGANEEAIRIFETYKDSIVYKRWYTFEDVVIENFDELIEYKVIEEAEKEKLESFIEKH